MQNHYGGPQQFFCNNPYVHDFTALNRERLASHGSLWTGAELRNIGADLRCPASKRAEFNRKVPSKPFFPFGLEVPKKS